MESFYSQESGAVINAAINKYVYITVNKKFGPGLRIKYSTTENVDTVDEIQHPLFREALKHVGIKGGIEVTSHADIPSRGSGLGSSSSFLVCLLHALHNFKGEFVTPERIAKEAVHIERNVLKEHGGLQDQYIAAYGDIRHMEFHDEGRVQVSNIFCSSEARKKLEKNLLMFYTGITRKSHDIQKKTVENTNINMERLRTIKKQASRLREELHKDNHEAVGPILHEYWLQKRGLSDKISSNDIDIYYDKAMQAGATGGKILGAGGGGFFLFYVPEEKQAAVREALADLQELPFAFEREGSKIIYMAENFTPEASNGNASE